MKWKQRKVFQIAIVSNIKAKRLGFFHVLEIKKNNFVSLDKLFYCKKSQLLLYYILHYAQIITGHKITKVLLRMMVVKELL